MCRCLYLQLKYVDTNYTFCTSTRAKCIHFFSAIGVYIISTIFSMPSGPYSCVVLCAHCVLARFHHYILKCTEHKTSVERNVCKWHVHMYKV